MQVLVHIFVLESIAGCLLKRYDRGIQVLQLRREAHADFERVRHFAVIRASLLYSVMVVSTASITVVPEIRHDFVVLGLQAVSFTWVKLRCLGVLDVLLVTSTP